MNCTITPELLSIYKQYLLEAEKAPSTIEKYLRDITAFSDFAGNTPITKETLIAYKAELMKRYKPASVNSMLSALNSFFAWCGWDLHIKALKIQHCLFLDESKELTRDEYYRLLEAAKRKNERLWLLIQTICATGIRVSELRFITVEAAKSGSTTIQCKGKNRTILIPSSLRKELLRYAKDRNRKSGSIFLTRTGKEMNRSNIWKSLKALCKAAGVLASKVFPHNLRHLFATAFYEAEKDISKLADVLGHSSINTTRIYITTSGCLHRQIMDRLGLVQAPSAQTTT